MRLTERDVNLLASLATHHFLSATQIQRLIFQRAKERRVRRRLQVLLDHQLVDRVAVVAQPTRGVPQSVYILTAPGAALLAAETGHTVQPYRLSRHCLRSVTHQLVVNDFFAHLTLAVAANGCAVRRWQHAWQLTIRGRDGVARAESVEIRDPRNQQRKQARLLPDAFFELVQPNGESLLFFAEIDLANHALSVWRERALVFTAYADPRQGLFRQRFGGGRRDNFRLLIVTTPDYRRRSRCDNILSTIYAAVGDSDLFLGVPLSDVTPERILGPVWRQPGKQERCSLLSNPGRAVKLRVRPVQSRSPDQVR
ncbi:MAG: replication-relaxation family protein [Pirellulaceae bacterium]